MGAAAPATGAGRTAARAPAPASAGRGPRPRGAALRPGAPGGAPARPPSPGPTRRPARRSVAQGRGRRRSAGPPSMAATTAPAVARAHARGTRGYQRAPRSHASGSPSPPGPPPQLGQRRPSRSSTRRSRRSPSGTLTPRSHKATVEWPSAPTARATSACVTPYRARKAPRRRRAPPSGCGSGAPWAARRPAGPGPGQRHGEDELPGGVTPHYGVCERMPPMRSPLPWSSHLGPLTPLGNPFPSCPMSALSAVLPCGAG